MKYFSWVGYISLFALLMSASIAWAEDLSTFKQTWQCKGCNLSQSDLSHFSTAHLLPADCSKDLVLVGANLSKASLVQANFSACVRGSQTQFKTINFNTANLTEADLSHSFFYGVSFIYADLAHAQLNGAELTLSDFSQANFSHAYLNNARSNRDAMHGWGSNFYLANFCGAELKQAHLYGYFRGANFCNTQLNQAVLISSLDAVPAQASMNQKITEAGLWAGINFKNADLRGARFENEKGEPADLSLAKFCRTLMPDGSVNDRDCAN